MIPVADMPPRNEGFARLVQIVTVNGQLSPEYPLLCEPHNPEANDPGCKWPVAPRRTFLQRTGDWARGWGNWLLEVFSDGD